MRMRMHAVFPPDVVLMQVRMTAARAIASLAAGGDSGQPVLSTAFFQPHVGTLLEAIAKVRLSRMHSFGARAG
jgi:hypothetical protein